MLYHDDISKLIWILKTSAHGIRWIEFLWKRESEQERMWTNIMSYVKWLCNFYDKNRKYVQIDTSQITFYASLCSRLAKCYSFFRFFWHSCLWRRRHDTKIVFFLLYHQCNLLIKFLLLFSSFFFVFNLVMIIFSRWDSSIVIRLNLFSA